MSVGKAAGRKMAALITDMDQPLGHAVGNALEVKEAVACLKGEYGGDLLELCLAIGGKILLLGGLAGTEAEARNMLQSKIDDGSALEKLLSFVSAQGGDPRAIHDTSLLPTAPVQYAVLSEEDGYVNRIDAEAVGLVSLYLGGGRAEKDDIIDPAVGLVLEKKLGEHVAAGERLATIHAASQADAEAAGARLRACYSITSAQPAPRQLIKGTEM